MPCDYSKYPPDWKTKIVPRILERADNKCEICGIRNYSTVFAGKIYTRQKNGRYSWRTIWVSDNGDWIRNKHLLSMHKFITVVLTVAHLDHDETNHDVEDDRLMAMCQLCHLNYDAKEKYRRKVEEK